MNTFLKKKKRLNLFQFQKYNIAKFRMQKGREKKEENRKEIPLGLGN